MWIGPTQPSDPNVEFWYDTDATPEAGGSVTSATVATIVTLTQAAYDAIVTKDPASLYFIT